MNSEPIDELPTIEFAFPGPLRDQLIAAIFAGDETSTSSLMRGHEVDGEALPEVGGRYPIDDDTPTVLERFRLL